MVFVHLAKFFPAAGADIAFKVIEVCAHFELSYVLGLLIGSD